MTHYDINNLNNGDRIYDKDEGRTYVLHFVSDSRSSFSVHTIGCCGMEIAKHLDEKENSSLFMDKETASLVFMEIGRMLQR